MGSDGEGGGKEAVVARKGRKRQMVLESSDSEADEYRILTRQKSDAAGAAAAVGNAGTGGRGGGDHAREEVPPVSSEELPGVKSTEGDGSESNKGGELNMSSTKSDPKKARTEAVNGGSVSKAGTSGKMLRPGFPTWRFEKPEVRAGRVDEKDEVEMKASSGSKFNGQVSGSDDRRRRVESLKHENHTPVKTGQGNLADSGRLEGVGEMKAKVKEQVSSLDDKRGRVEPLKHNKGMPLTTGKGNLVESGKREVIRVQGKSGVLMILPKNNKVASEIGDGKVLPKKTKVDGEIGDSKAQPKAAKVVETRDGKIPTKSGVLKLIPKNTNRENSDVKLLPKNIKVDEETENGRIPMKNIKVEGETSDGKILTKTSKMDRQSGDDKVMTKSCKVDVETGAGKIQASNNKVVEETSDVYRQDKEKSSALDESQKQDANGGKRVTGKLVSSIILRRSDPSVVGVSSGDAMKQRNSKAQAQLKTSSLGNRQPSLSLKNEKTKLGEHKSEKKRLLENKGSPENLSKKAKLKVTDLQGTSDSTLKEHVMKKPRGGPRSTAKQKLRDQIKHMLLDNGWKIELRPRRSKDYEDSVYVSPQGSGYWSITKAYAVFQEHLKNSHTEKPKGRSSKLNNHELGVADSSSDAISKDDLAILKRNVQKRRNNKEHFAGKKCVDNRRRDLEDSLAGRSSRKKCQNNEERLKIKHQGCSLLVRGSTRDTEGVDAYIPYKWKRTVLSWMIDLGIVSEDMKVKYMNKKGKRERLEGRITREGIYCGCCSKILTVAKFEIHAGSKEQQPYANIVLEDGEVSLLQCLLDAWDKQAQYEKKGFYTIDPADDPDDDTCGICGDGGDLLCCDLCTSTFHVACLGIEMPLGDWYCRSCICKFCGTAEEKTSSFAELLSCLQCSRKYHKVCAPGTEKDSVCTKPGATIDSFCSPGCRKIYKRLKRLLGSKNTMEAGFSWSLVHCFADSKTAPPKEKAQSVLCNSKTAVAFSVIDECFLPRIDERSGINVIHNVVYNCGSDFNRLDFRGFYTFILERGDEVISAATVRIHGADLAEMPFIGTRGIYRRQRMCHRLLNAIESALGSLNVRRLVIPAIPELQKAWTTAFGFKPVGPMKKQKFKSFNLLIIHGTGLLEKRLLLTGQINQVTTAGTVNTIGCNKMDAQMFGEASGSITPVHASPELAVGGDREAKDHDNSSALNESVAGLTSDLPPSPGDKIPERTSPFCVDDDNLRTIPGVGKDDMPCKVEADSTEKIKYAETDGTLAADTFVSEQNSSDKTNSSHADSSVVPVTVDPCSLNELGKGENCTSGELSVEVDRVREKTECNLNSSAFSVHSDTREDKQTPLVCADTKVHLVTTDQKTDNLELKDIVADGDTQSSLEVKGLDVMVNGRSIDAYATKDQTFVCDATNNAVATTEDHDHSAVDLVVVSTERPVQQKDRLVKDKAGSPSSDLKHSSTSVNILLQTSDETVSIESKKTEMKDATVEVGTTAERSNGTGIRDSVLDTSNDDCEVVAKPSLTCGEGQLHGEDAIHNNSMEDCLASREPVNA